MTSDADLSEVLRMLGQAAYGYKVQIDYKKEHLLNTRGIVLKKEFTVEQMNDKGHIKLSEKRAADIVGARINFHFRNGDLICNVLSASFSVTGEKCPQNRKLRCNGCTSLFTDKGEVIMCAKSNKFLKQIEHGVMPNE